MILVYCYIELNNTTSYVLIESVDSTQKKKYMMMYCTNLFLISVVKKNGWIKKILLRYTYIIVILSLYIITWKVKNDPYIDLRARSLGETY
jgi:FtsH-binding integral membrane protein